MQISQSVLSLKMNLFTYPFETLNNLHKCVSSNAYLFNHSNKLNFNVIICTENGSSAGFQITDENDEIDHWVDAADPARSNWLRYINSPLTEDEANLDMVQFKDDIYYQVIDAIPEGKVDQSLPLIILIRLYTIQYNTIQYNTIQ